MRLCKECSLSRSPGCGLPCVVLCVCVLLNSQAAGGVQVHQQYSGLRGTAWGSVVLPSFDWLLRLVLPRGLVRRWLLPAQGLGFVEGSQRPGCYLQT